MSDLETRIVVVSAVIARAGRALLTQRDPARSDYGWAWETPGGKVEPGETDLEALARELREEIDVDAVISPDVLARLDLDPGCHLGVDRFTSVSFLRVTRMSGTPRARESIGIGWFSAEELGGLTMTPATDRFRARLQVITWASGGSSTCLRDGL